ncbi:MAG: glycogen/starch/alpha-glucan phosphorylase [Deltaproteobacteria bacterium]|nr:glycogen/starch/alpha-glucan phosphorylase [Deltaproteobacteria bacterium]
MKARFDCRTSSELEAQERKFLHRTKHAKVQVEDDRTGMSLESFKRAFLNNLHYIQGVDASMASSFDYYMALAYTVRDRLMHRWIKTEQVCAENEVKTVYYLSAEFLMGRQLGNNLMNVGCFELARQALKDLDLDLHDIMEHEAEPGLGNGGLGRLAACFLDSLATLDIPAVGYGIRYEFGIFEQTIRDGWQVERPDRWLLYGNPWEFPRPRYTVEVKFGGRTESYEINGRRRTRWMPLWKVIGVPFDTLVPGYHTATVNTLCLWSAKASDEFDFAVFDSGDYTRAVAGKNLSENITKVLYPNDNTPQGRELRLQQQYFFVSCALQDVIRGHLWKYHGVEGFEDHAAIQLNDTHPAIAVAELMRLFLDELGLEWDHAWRITQKTFGYTNHTLLAEALERWPVSMFERLLPRHLEIIYEINRLFMQEIQVRFPGDPDRLGRMSLIEEGETKQVRMGHLACVGSHSINGVAALHSRLLKDQLFRDFFEAWPEKFSNKTNGVTPRRWLLLSNPKLALLITKKIGKSWVTNLEELKQLEDYVDDAKFQESWRKIKRENKQDLAEYIKHRNHLEINSESLYDVQVKRLHEYKRQLLNVLYIVTLYNRLKANPSLQIVPRTFILGGKAAPGYFVAKLVIKLINSVAEAVNNDPDVRDQIKVVFLANYSVSLGQRVYPAADLSEQISTAGMEASGTGNMKFSLNGALTIGTLDGANIEIRDAVGADNFFLFGHTVSQLVEIRNHGYHPRGFYESNHELRGVLDRISSGYFSPGNTGLFQPLVDSLLNEDRYMLLADYQSYVDCQQRVNETYQDQVRWTRMSIINSANMGRFSSDRTISEYCDEIWKANPIQVELDSEVEERFAFLSKESL